MQCILYKIYFWKVFHMYYNLICIFICTPICTKFYSCKKWVLHPNRTITPTGTIIICMAGGPMCIDNASDTSSTALSRIFRLIKAVNL
jgi:hypothetical protein